MGLTSTPESRFEDVPDYGYEPRSVGVGEPGMAYVDVDGDGDETFLCLHGEPTWGFLYRRTVPRLRDRGRVVVPDFVGFGRSDKYDEVDAYSFGMHYRTLGRFVEALDLDGVTLVCQDWGSILGLPLAASDQPGQFDRIVATNALLTDGEVDLPEPWYEFRDMVVGADQFDVGRLVGDACVRELTEAERAAYDAPFPSEAAKAGAYAWPPMVPQSPEMEGTDVHARLREDLAGWEKPFLALFSDGDPIEGASHLIQEDAGEACAERVVSFVDRT